MWFTSPHIGTSTDVQQPLSSLGGSEQQIDRHVTVRYERLSAAETIKLALSALTPLPIFNLIPRFIYDFYLR